MENSPASLRISPDLDLPLNAITSKVLIVGMSGSGKTNTGVSLTEEIIGAGQQVVIFDPLGVWYGLRSGRDGESVGLPIPILGGEHSDVPLAAGSGKAVAEWVIESRSSAVIDMGDWLPNVQRQFVADFCEALYHKSRAAMHLIIDEADEFAPLSPIEGGPEMKSLGELNRIAKRGRARGIGLTMITQRPQALSATLRSQAEVLIALRMSGPLEAKAVDTWLSAHADKEQRAEVLKSLPHLATGEAWVASGHLLGSFSRVQMRERETCDSSATPKVGETKRQSSVYAAVDVESIREQLGQAAEQILSVDPAALRAELERMRQELAERPSGTVERVEVPALAPDQIDHLSELAQAMMETAADLIESAGLLGEALQRWEGEPKSERVPSQALAVPLPANSISEPSPAAAAPTREKAPVCAVASTLDATEQKIVDALAAFHAVGISPIERPLWSAYAGPGAKSSSVSSKLAGLRDRGLIAFEGADRYSLLPRGTKAANAPQRPLTLASLHSQFEQVVMRAADSDSSGRRRVAMLREIIRRRRIDRDALAEATGQSPTSSSYVGHLAALRTLGLINQRGGDPASATSRLFPEGLE